MSTKRFVQLPFGTRDACTKFAAALIAADFPFRFHPEFPQFVVTLRDECPVTVHEFEGIVKQFNAHEGECHRPAPATVPRATNAPFEMFAWSTDDHGQRRILLTVDEGRASSIPFSAAQTRRLRDELVRLIP